MREPPEMTAAENRRRINKLRAQEGGTDGRGRRKKARPAKGKGKRKR